MTLPAAIDATLKKPRMFPRGRVAAARCVKVRRGSTDEQDQAGAMTYRFAEFEVDAAAYEVRRGAHRIPLSRQPMDLLLLLLERPQHLVSREEIAKRLWAPGVFTDLDAGIHTAVLKIRQALGDSRQSPQFVETVPGKGYRFVAAVDVVASSPPVASLPRRHNLPPELTSFIGREKELTELAGLFASSRVLSLTGTGGVGKTRLALRLAANLISEFPDGVWLIDLAPLSAPDLVPQAVATTLGIREAPQRSLRDGLPDALRQRAALLVLDNCEHLIAACADLVHALLGEPGSVRILATSREALGVSGETVYRVPSMALPDVTPVSAEALVDSEATRLFVERARAMDPSFVPGPDDAGVIVDICRRLDGIPLAIELAAARVVGLSVGQIARRLQDRFRLLTGGARTAVARHRTLGATVAWSYQLLPEVERLLLCRLSIFPAAWSLETAEKVCSGDGIDEHDVLELLMRLIGKSLVVVESDRLGERRYRYLETIRQYARERLMESETIDQWRDRHFNFFFDEFRGARPVLRSAGQVALLRRLQDEQENIRAALDWALTSPALRGQAVELAGALFWYWTKRGQFEEGRQWLERALMVEADLPGTLRARALIGLAHMNYFQGTLAHGVVAEALSLGRETGDSWVVSVASFLLGLAALERGDRDEALACALEARKAASAGGGAVEHGGPLFILADIAVSNGDYDRAQRLYDESIEVHRQASESWGLGIQLVAAAAMRLLREEHREARAQVSEALSLFQELEDSRGIAYSLELLAGLHAAGGHHDRAARLWAAADALLETMGAVLPPNMRLVRERYLGTVRASLGAVRFELVRAEGRAMPVAEAIAHACQG
jgi:predicted ATPase/DNA-binding winged helix-turn-helix (wHTH) protein